MKKLKEVLHKIQKSGVVTSLALAVVAMSQMAIGDCFIWVFGQEDAPEEIL